MNLKQKAVDVLTRKNTVAGLEIMLADGSTIVFRLCLLRKVKSVIQKQEIFTCVNEYKTLKSHIPADTPVVITIDGKNIIHKKVSGLENTEVKTLLQKVLPNAEPNDFYLQYQPSGDSAFVSVVRKDTINKLLEELTKHKIDVISCSFGPFSLNKLLSFIDVNSLIPEFTAGDYNLLIIDNRIDSFQLTTTTADSSSVNIGDEKLEREYLVSYGAGMDYFIKGLDGNKLAIPHLVSHASEFNQKQMFRSLGLMALVFFISLLGINYAFFNHYFSKKAKLDLLVSAERSSIDRYDTLKSMYLEKKRFLAKTGMLDNPRTSFYADKIARDVPSEITLSEMNINPAIKSVNDDNKDLSFSSGIIDISGICKNSLDLDNWIKLIQKNAWVKVVNVLNYLHDREINEGKFNIEVETR